MAAQFREALETTSSTESKHEAFLRLAEKRTNSVLEKLRILSNLANPYAYTWTDEEVHQMYAAIEQELKLSRAKFQQVQRGRRRFTMRPSPNGLGVEAPK